LKILEWKEVESPGKSSSTTLPPGQTYLPASYPE